MALNALQDQTTLETLEASLLSQTDALQRLAIIDKLAPHYVFTNGDRASVLLREQEDLLQQYNYPDFQLSYYFNRAMIENLLNNYETAETYCLKLIDLVDQLGTAKQQVEALIDYAGVAINLQKMDQAGDLLNRAENILSKYPNEQLSARLKCREGFWELLFNNYPKAIELFLSANKEFAKLAANMQLVLKDYYFLSLVYSGLGRVYERNEDNQKSIDAYLKVVDMCEQYNIKTRLSWHYLNLGNGYKANGEIGMAGTYFIKSIESAQDLDLISKASSYGNLGWIYMQQESYEDALNLFEEAEELYAKRGDKDYSNLSIIHAWKGETYASTGQDEDAFIHFDKAYEYAQKADNFKQLASVSKMRANFYAQKERYKEAYHFYESYDNYNQQHQQQLNKNRQTEIEVKYEAAERRQEMERLKLEATSLRLKALRAQMNPHFMYNALNSIQNHITSQDTKSAAKFLAKFALLMRQSLDYSEVEFISLEKELEFLENYLYINQKLRFSNRLQYNIDVDDELEDDIIRIPAMIIQPYIENAIEHGLRSKKEGLITLEFSAHGEDAILCIVEDNGIGRERAKQMQAEDIRYSNHKSRGTSITEKRLNILAQTHYQGISVKTVDLKDAKGIGVGTRIEILAPIVDGH